MKKIAMVRLAGTKYVGIRFGTKEIRSSTPFMDTEKEARDMLRKKVVNFSSLWIH
jgi:hypothetical protein